MSYYVYELIDTSMKYMSRLVLQIGHVISPLFAT